jgi:hypothetical protein
MVKYSFSSLLYGNDSQNRTVKGKNSDFVIGDVCAPAVLASSISIQHFACGQ